MGAHRYGLRDDQWERIEGLLPGRQRSVGRPAEDNRRLWKRCCIAIATGYHARFAGAFRRLPGCAYPVQSSARRGVGKKLFDRLAQDADNDYAMIDSTIVRDHQHSAGALKKKGVDPAIGRSKGGLSTKIHATVDALGNRRDFILPAGKLATWKAPMCCCRNWRPIYCWLTKASMPTNGLQFPCKRRAKSPSSRPRPTARCSGLTTRNFTKPVT